MLELMAQAEKQNKYGEPDNFRNEMPRLTPGQWPSIQAWARLNHRTFRYEGLK
jgi:hypothetical protein